MSAGQLIHPRGSTGDSSVRRVIDGAQGWMARETSAGLALMACTAVALVAANSPWAAAWGALWSTPVTVGVGGAALSYPAWYWINDALMAVFFFVVGLEIKRELLEGELSDRRARVLPVVGALGGAIVPVALFLVMGPGQAGARAWAVPMATDIAFVVGCLALLGRRVPIGLKCLLLSLAVVDDLLAVSVVAIFYTSSIAGAWLVAAAFGLWLVWLLRESGVRAFLPYVLIGAGVWLCTLKSGIHPTIAGVVLALMTPAVAAPGESASPLHRLEHALMPWVAFAIMPLFALANAGVTVSATTLGEPVALAVGVGLAVGKPLGIVAAAALFVRAGWARLPAGVGWLPLVGAGCLAGVGFTMSLFIAGLGLQGTTLDAAKTGVLIASAVSMLLGLGILRRSLPLPAH